MKSRRVIFTIEVQTERRVKDLIKIFKETLNNMVDVSPYQVQSNVIKKQRR